MNNHIRFTIFYSFIKTDRTRYHTLSIDKRNIVAKTKELTDMAAMINGDSVIEAKQHLGSVLAVAVAAELPGGWRDIRCRHCGAEQSLRDKEMVFVIIEPAWSNCAGCVMK